MSEEILIKSCIDRVSVCCGASVYVAGNTTHYYVCEACEMPCNVRKNEPDSNDGLTKTQGL